MASVKTATKPMASMNQCTDSMRYVMAAPTAQTTSIMSRYDWKSVQFQKYLKSRSESVDMFKFSKCFTFYISYTIFKVLYWYKVYI